MFLFSTILSILLGKARGGTFGKLAQADLKRTNLIFAVLLGRFVLYSSILKVSDSVAGFIHTALFLLLGWAFYANLHIPGMGMAALGSMLNTIVIAANGGRMPVSELALRASGLWETTGAALLRGVVKTHAISLPGTRLVFLGDIMSLRWPWGSGVVYSIGDIVLIVGMFFAIQHLMGAGGKKSQS